MHRVKQVIVLVAVILLYLSVEPAASYAWGRMLGFKTVESTAGEAGLRLLHLMPALVIAVLGGAAIGCVVKKAWTMSIFAVVAAAHRFFAYPQVLGGADLKYFAFAAAEGLCIALGVVAAYAVARSSSRSRTRSGQPE